MVVVGQAALPRCFGTVEICDLDGVPGWCT